VDDDGLVLTNTIAMLEDLGHTVFPASSGKEALDILRREDPVDLVIADQVMPHMTGVQLAEAIQKEWPDLSVIIATGYAEIEPGVGMGLPKFSKPFTEDELAEKLALILPRMRKSGRVLKFRADANPAV
jgi:CheY-like chemotaxis protein